MQSLLRKLSAALRVRAARRRSDVCWMRFGARLTTGAGENTMRPLLAISTAIDQLNEKIGYICNFLVLAACLVSAGNAMIRYAFGY